MDDKAYTEPTNEQLARFLIVYAQRIPEMANRLELSEPILERLMDRNPHFREAALLHHRRFQEEIHELSRKMAAGELQCERILLSGKRCPNRNEPGRSFCGLHRDPYEEEHEDPE